MGWFDDDDDSDDGRGTRPARRPPPPDPGERGGDGGNDDVDPLDAYMASVHATVASDAKTTKEGGDGGGDGGQEEEEEEEDPLDAYMNSLGSAGESGGCKKTKSAGGRLDLDNEEEATSHWRESSTDASGAAGGGGPRLLSCPSSATAAASSSTSSYGIGGGRYDRDDDGSSGFHRAGGGGTTQPPSHYGSSEARAAMASTFHRAGAKKKAEKTAIDHGGGDDDSDEDGEALLKKQWDGPIDPLAKVDHSGVQYEPFRRTFYRPRNTDAGRTWREENHVTCQPGTFDPILTFAELGRSGGGTNGEGGEEAAFAPELLAAIAKEGYTTPTPVQSQTLPAALSGRDALVTASTGSGKTLAFVWPLVVHCCDQHHIEPGIDGPIGLVLTPTRELTKQVHRHCRKMLSCMGGKAVEVAGGNRGTWELTKELQKGCEVVVSTPGRLIDMVKSKGTNLRRVTFVVLDEADRLLDMGFEKQVTSILENVRPDRQTMLFSATFGRRVERVAKGWLKNPARIAIGQTGTSSENVTQHTMVLPSYAAKKQWLIEMLPTLAELGRMIVFVASRADCEEVAKNMRDHPAIGGKGLRVDSLHGDKDQRERNAALLALKKGNAAALVATDVAARGLDVRDVMTVVNFDCAKNLDSHVHRIGRAGRMSASDGGEYKKGTAYTLLTPKDADFANVLLDAFTREGREVTNELKILAQKSKRYGGGRSRTSKSGLGFHDRGHAPAPSGAPVAGGNYYGPASGEHRSPQPPARKRSRWG